MAKRKNKNKFKEPAEGWFFHPSGDMCMSCTKLHDNCSGLKFNEMRIVLDTYEGHKVVKCSEHLHNMPYLQAKAMYEQMNFSAERAEELATNAMKIWFPETAK